MYADTVHTGTLVNRMGTSWQQEAPLLVVSGWKTRENNVTAEWGQDQWKGISTDIQAMKQMSSPHDLSYDIMTPFTLTYLSMFDQVWHLGISMLDDFHHWQKVVLLSWLLSNLRALFWFHEENTDESLALKGSLVRWPGPLPPPMCFCIRASKWWPAIKPRQSWSRWRVDGWKEDVDEAGVSQSPL